MSNESAGGAPLPPSTPVSAASPVSPATEAQSNSDLRSAFSSLDADKDTYLTPSELAKWNKMDKSGGASSDRGASSGGASSNSVSEPADSSASAAPKSAE